MIVRLYGGVNTIDQLLMWDSFFGEEGVNRITANAIRLMVVAAGECVHTPQADCWLYNHPITFCHPQTAKAKRTLPPSTPPTCLFIFTKWGKKEHRPKRGHFGGVCNLLTFLFNWPLLFYGNFQNRIKATYHQVLWHSKQRIVAAYGASWGGKSRGKSQRLNNIAKKMLTVRQYISARWCKLIAGGGCNSHVEDWK